MSIIKVYPASYNIENREYEYIINKEGNILKYTSNIKVKCESNIESLKIEIDGYQVLGVFGKEVKDNLIHLVITNKPIRLLIRYDESIDDSDHKYVTYNEIDKDKN